MFEKNRYKQIFPANDQGRDFIVGDLHGCRALLDAKLAEVGFDKTVDRLFCTGDLVDRGPDSEGCLELLLEPWFHSVLGNHDAMLMAWLYDGKQDDPRRHLYAGAFTENDGWQWAERFTRAAEFLPLLESLPFVIEVEDQFEIVHAELLDFLHNPEEPQAMYLGVADHFVAGFGNIGTWQDHLLWGRSIRLHMQTVEDRPSFSDALSLPVYCGHTICRKPMEYAGHRFLDTGAYCTGVLTMVESAAWDSVKGPAARATPQASSMGERE